jgi:hypothetical protein
VIIVPSNVSAAAGLTIKSFSLAESPTSSTALPAHSVGDLIVVLAANTQGGVFSGGSGVACSAPPASGNVPVWTTGTFLQSNVSLRLAYTVATSSGHTFGQWNAGTTATAVAIVLSGFKSSSFIGQTITGGINYDPNFTTPSPSSIPLTPVSTSINSRYFFICTGYSSANSFGVLPSSQTVVGNASWANIPYRVSYNNVGTSTVWDGPGSVTGSGFLYMGYAGIEILSS